jgi:polyisoprenyl-phosphate glycosyltransferase
MSLNYLLGRLGLLKPSVVANKDRSLENTSRSYQQLLDCTTQLFHQGSLTFDLFHMLVPSAETTTDFSPQAEAQPPKLNAHCFKAGVEERSQRLKLTIICPVYNEEKVVPLFFERIKPVIEELSPGYDVNLIFSNNASTDGTLAEILKLRETHPYVFVTTLSANVGYQRSLECGLRTCKGDLFAFIDVDCEDPPEMILEFVKAYEEGYDIVYGERLDRDEAEYVKLMRKIFYRVLRAVADEEVILDMAEFSLMTEEVRDAIVQDNTSFPFIRASIGRAGYKRRGIPYRRHKRIAGETHYNFFGMTKFAVAGILSSSTLLLRLPIYSLPFWLLAVSALAIARVFFDNKFLDAGLILLFASYIGSTVSFIAIYVARIYKNTLGRPNYIINRKATFRQP